jgi:hypothetical protein
MGEFEDCLERFSKNHRVAFAAACAERALPFYERAVDTPSPFLSQVVEMAWKVAEGEDINVFTLSETHEQVSFVKRLLQLKKLSVALAACDVVLFALQAIDDDSSESAAKVAQRMIDLYEEGGNQSAVQEEEDWQNRALDLLETCRHQGAGRDLFQLLNS